MNNIKNKLLPSILVLAVFALMACGASETPDQRAQREKEQYLTEMYGTAEEVQKKIDDVRKNPPIISDERTHLLVPSDSKASYFILERAGKYPIRSITTEREGRSGLSFSKRQCDCTKKTYKEIFTGETVEEIEESKKRNAKDKMVDLVQGSTAYYACEAACQK